MSDRAEIQRPMVFSLLPRDYWACCTPRNLPFRLCTRSTVRLSGDLVSCLHSHVPRHQDQRKVSGCCWCPEEPSWVPSGSPDAMSRTVEHVQRRGYHLSAVATTARWPPEQHRFAVPPSASGWEPPRPHPVNSQALRNEESASPVRNSF
ncbi:hypothetical protein MRX96_010241 [Rhipicephalus microplus]